MLSDLLFENTHRVEQLVNINSKKKVDKVLLKVIKTVRNKCNTNNWIKVESDLRDDLNLSDKNIKSICSTLNEFYNVEIDPATIASVQDIVCYIKAHQPNSADSLFLVDSNTLDIDEDDDTNSEPKENLEVDPEIIKSSEPSDTVEEKVPENVKPSTEIGLLIAAGALALGAGIAGAIVYFREKKTKEFHDWIEKNYSSVCKFIKEKLKDNPVFFSKRGSLWTVDSLIDVIKEKNS